MLDTMAGNDISHWAAVYRKLQGTENGPLEEAYMEQNGWWLVLPKLDILGSAFEVGVYPRYRYGCHTELWLQTLEQDLVVYGVEGCRQVEADQNCDLLVISSSVDAVQDVQ